MVPSLCALTLSDRHGCHLSYTTRMSHGLTSSDGIDQSGCCRSGLQPTFCGFMHKVHYSIGTDQVHHGYAAGGWCTAGSSDVRRCTAFGGNTVRQVYSYGQFRRLSLGVRQVYGLLYGLVGVWRVANGVRRVSAGRCTAGQAAGSVNTGQSGPSTQYEDQTVPRLRPSGTYILTYI